jgi:hypothetical protein
MPGFERGTPPGVRVRNVARPVIRAAYAVYGRGSAEVSVDFIAPRKGRFVRTGAGRRVLSHGHAVYALSSAVRTRGVVVSTSWPTVS